jgi:transketolase
VVWRALEAARQLAAEGISARVLNFSTVQPIDREAILRAAEETGGIVAAEEHTVHGGLGSAIAEVVVGSRPVPMRLIGVPGVFAPTGSAEWLMEHFGITAAGIRAAALQLVEQRVSHGTPARTGN